MLRYSEYDGGMPTLDLDAKSVDGKSVMVVVPYIQPNGQPSVMMIVKKSATGVFETTLDGEPAFALSLSEDQNGNGPWVVGDLLVSAWEQAKKMVGRN
jgi:hypothetical protein